MASVPASSALLALSKRQTGVTPNNFPPQCESGCTSILTTISSCDAVAYLCTSENIAAYQSCINCLVASTNATSAVVAAGQSAIGGQYILLLKCIIDTDLSLVQRSTANALEKVWRRSLRLSPLPVPLVQAPPRRRPLAARGAPAPRGLAELP